MKFVTPAVLALLSTSTQARNPGFGGSITADGLNNAKNVATPIIFNYLKNIQIPEIDITGGKFTNLDIKINQPALTNVDLSLDHSSNSAELKASGVTTYMTSDFTFKYLFLKVSGTAVINIKNLGIDAQIEFAE
jgi:hypothetical protein